MNYYTGPSCLTLHVYPINSNEQSFNILTFFRKKGETNFFHLDKKSSLFVARMSSRVELSFSYAGSPLIRPSDPQTTPVAICGRLEALHQIDFNSINYRLEPRVSKQTWQKVFINSKMITKNQVQNYTNYKKFKIIRIIKNLSLSFKILSFISTNHLSL